MNMPATLPTWPHAFGLPAVSGRLRCQPEDFEVEELPAFLPSGEGTHLWLWVEKISANTDWVAGQLARAAGCSPRDVGYAGMKDRHAVTRQWFSLPWNKGAEEPFPACDIPGVKVLHTSLNEKKLRRGILKGNQFRIVLRELQGDIEGLEARLEQIALRGVPNYFGQQRFGFGGSNVDRAAQWLQHGGRLSRQKRSIYLSSLRSFLFNQVLARRLELDHWDSLIGGDLAMLDGTHSLFACDGIDDALAERCRKFDIHPTGPLPGRGGMQASGAAADLEQQVLEPYQEWIAGLAKLGVDASRRSLRLAVKDFSWQWQDQGEDRCLQLEFSLPAGAYATVVIRELMNEGPVDNHVEGHQESGAEDQPEPGEEG